MQRRPWQSGSRPVPAPAAPASWRCPACGSANRAYATFCLGCGEPPSGNDPAPPVPNEAPSPHRRLLQAAAVLMAGLALALLLANWYTDETHAANYRQGAAAVAAADWSAAAARFRAAGSFADAATRATQAESNLRDQTQLAHAAEYAGAARNWPDLLAILDRLLKLDPHDPAAQAQRTYAQSMILDEGLAGTLYLIATGPQAGLYLNLPGARDLKLPGSDGRSRPRALAPTGDRLVYDRPRRDLSAGATAAAGSGREAVLAAFGRPPGAPAGPAPGPLGIQVLPPAIAPSLTGQFVPGGLFWQTFSADDGLPGGSVVFYRFADGQTVPIRASGQWRYVGASSDVTGVNLLVVPPRLAADPAISLLSIGRAGEPPILEMHLSGWVTASAFSADGRYLVFTMQDGTINTSLSTSLYVVDLPPAAPGTTPRALVQFLQSITSAGPQPPTLNAEFVPAATGGPQRILVTLTDGPQQSLSLVRLADGLAADVWTGTTPRRSGPHAFSSDGAWLAYMAEEGDGTRLVVQGLAAATAPRSLAGAGFRGSDTSLQFAPGGHYLVYRAPGPAGGTAGALYSAAVAPVAGPAGGLPPLRAVYLGTAAADAGEPALVLAPGGHLLLYRDPQGTLHAVAYDGTFDLPLALPGPVAGVWSLSR